MKQLSFFDYAEPELETSQRQVKEILNLYDREQKLLAGIIGQNGNEIVRKLFDLYPSMQIIANSDVAELATAVGGEAAEKIMAIMTLAKGIFKQELVRIYDESDVYKLMKPYAAENKENFWTITLNTKMKVLGVHRIYTGSINEVSNVRIAELLRPAIVMNANSIILVHNHPSGDTSPSPQDIAFTRTILAAAKPIDIQVNDHIIIGNGSHSIRKNSPHIF